GRTNIDRFDAQVMLAHAADNFLQRAAGALSPVQVELGPLDQFGETGSAEHLDHPLMDLLRGEPVWSLGAFGRAETERGSGNIAARNCEGDYGGDNAPGSSPHRGKTQHLDSPPPRPPAARG